MVTVGYQQWSDNGVVGLLNIQERTSLERKWEGLTGEQVGGANWRGSGRG